MNMNIYVNFNFVNNELKFDKEFVLQVVKLNGFAVKFVSDELRRDKEVAGSCNSELV